MSMRETMSKNATWLLVVVVVAVGIAVAVWFRPSEPLPTIQPTHIVLISIDTCRADHLECYERPASTGASAAWQVSEPYTPNLDALAQEGILFENVVSPAPITLPAHSTMLTGTIPPYHGVHDNGTYYLDDVFTTLPEVLRDHGYVTGAITSAFVLDSRYGLDQGFDDYNDRFDEPGAVERKGAETTYHACNWLDQHQHERGFLFLHYFDPHMDYEAPEPWADRFLDHPYSGEIAYTDDCIGEVIKKLKDLGIYDTTLLIVTSDHGEMLGEHGEVTHTYFVYQGVLRVPWIVKLPRATGAGPVEVGPVEVSKTEPRRIDALVGVVDIAPTICGLVGIEMPAPVQGTDRSGWIWGRPPGDAQRPQYCESITPIKYNANPLCGLVTSDWKFIHTTRPELYDLQADPGERRNLVEHDPARAAAMLKQLHEMLQIQSPHKGSDPSLQDEQSVRNLNQLGYVSGAEPVHDNIFTLDPARGDPKDLITLHDPASQVHGHIHHKEFALAREICEKLVSQHPGISEGHFLLAKIAVEEGRHAEAADHLTRYLVIKPDDPVGHNRLGRVLWEQGHPDRAVQAYRRALQLNPLLPEAHGDLGILLVRQGELDEGIGHLRKTVELKTESDVAHRFLADALSTQQEFEQAAHHYDQAIQLNAGNGAAHAGLVRILNSQGRQGAAIEHLRQAITVNPDFVTAHQTLGELLQSQGKLVEALTHFRRAMVLKPDSVALMNNVAWVLATHPDQDVRQAEEALHIAQRAANETGRTNPVVLDTLAAAYANANQYDLAVSTARSALELLTTPGQEVLKKKILGRLSLYEQEQAYRESNIH
jgi:arylsulfatase A-like enzyme/Tfp pilus assembly protein PilF